MNSPRSAIRNTQLIQFHVPFAHVGKIDKENGIIHGVSLITGGIKARGHDLEVDHTTLQQLFLCASKMGQVPVKWNHKTGADAVNGYVTNFWIDDDKLRGDWHLLQTHSQYQQALELAERMPKNIGLSAAFVPPEILTGRDVGKARCEELISVDLVAQPAANPGGLLEDGRFAKAERGIWNAESEELKVDSGAKAKSMAEPISTETEPTLAELKQLIQSQGEQIKQLTEGFAALQGGDEPTLADLADMSDEQLIAIGLDPSKVDAALQEAVQSGQLKIEGDVAGHVEAGAAGSASPATATAGEMATALATLNQRIAHFETKEKREVMLAEKREQESLVHAFEVVEAKCTELAARNQALELLVKSGAGKAVSAGGEIQLDAATGKPVTFETIVNTKFAELMKEPGMTASKAKSQAVEFGVKRHTAAYREFRSSGRGQIEFSVA